MCRRCLTLFTPLVIAFGLLLGCKEEPKQILQRPAEEWAGLSDEQAEEGLLFTFFDGPQMRTVERVQSIPEKARRAVMVTDPKRRLSGKRIYVADLTRRDQAKRYPVWIEEYGAWLDRVMARRDVREAMPLRRRYAQQAMLREASYTGAGATRAVGGQAQGGQEGVKPPDDRTTGESGGKRKKASQRKARSRSGRGTHLARRDQGHNRDIGRKKRARRTPKSAASKKRVQLAAAQPKRRRGRHSVTIYGTAWCPSCKLARQTMKQRGIPYVDIDVEKDVAAATRMKSIQKANGFTEGAVPLVVIDGRAYQGFSLLRMAPVLATLET